MGVSSAEELETAYSFLCCPIIQECSEKENPDRKKIYMNEFRVYRFANIIELIGKIILLKIDF